MVANALRVRPHAACIVPERRAEVTTEGGLNAAGQTEALRPMVAALRAAGIRVSLFIDPDERQLQAAADLRADIVELHTGAYAEGRAGELDRLRSAAALTASLGLECHAGHGLTYDNVQAVAALPEVVELNIGHFIIGQAITDGLPAVVARMRELIADVTLMPLCLRAALAWWPGRACRMPWPGAPARRTDTATLAAAADAEIAAHPALYTNGTTRSVLVSRDGEVHGAIWGTFHAGYNDDHDPARRSVRDRLDTAVDLTTEVVTDARTPGQMQVLLRPCAIASRQADPASSLARLGPGDPGGPARRGYLRRRPAEAQPLGTVLPLSRHDGAAGPDRPARPARPRMTC